jgi:SAM-dependent methyltransferase
MITAMPEVRKNRFGFHELADKPSAEELKAYYANKYFQNGKGDYQSDYSEEEREHIVGRLEQKLLIAGRFLSPAGNPPPAFLDIGAGEGWALDFFCNHGWRSVGLDYSDYGCRSHHPQRLGQLIVGDIYDNLRDLLCGDDKFDLILLDNVLEHVLEPLDLLKALHRLIADGGMLIVEVPNDFSTVQLHLLENGYISRPFWIAVPDHISYFNREGLEAICSEAGWVEKYLMGDFPIDLDLFSRKTNYIENPEVGKLSHKRRVAIENLLNVISPDKTAELWRSMAELGLGRQIIGFYQAS